MPEVAQKEPPRVPEKNARRPVREAALDSGTSDPKRQAADAESDSSLNEDEDGLVDTPNRRRPEVAGPKRSVGEAALDAGTSDPKRQAADAESDGEVDLTLPCELLDIETYVFWFGY